ncbi:L-methionine/branched-chain amino acid transporter [Leucothrix sargassi]|nr:L-methionine/branched-chain amino acid transporter [Leucothrix sargassi]
MTGLNSTITRWQGVGLMASTLLGTGVFILPQLTVNEAGAWALWTWALLVLAILPLGWVFAVLSKEFPHAGGPAFFVQQAFGMRYGHIVGMMFACVVPLGAPAALMMTFEFLKPLVELTPLQALVGQIAVILGMFAINIKGMQLSGKIQLLITLAIAGVVFAMIAAFFTSAEAIVVADDLKQGSASGVMAAISLAIWGFLGIEAVTHLSSEFKNPKKDFVPAVMMGLTLVGVVFIFCAYLSMFDPSADLAMVSAYQALLGDSGPWVIGILGLVSGFATVNVYYASVARLVWVLSNDGVLPKALSTTNQHGVPQSALCVVQVVSIVIILGVYAVGEDYEQMVRWVNGVFVFIYAMSMMAAWRLLSKKHRPAVVLGLVVCAVFVYCLGFSMIYGGLLVVVLFAWTYLADKKRPAKAGL